jgi:alpha-beta hydrolase superfamily lysophospholipase
MEKPQLSLLKEHFIDDYARRFRDAGLSALVYDHRGWGSSEGFPKYETNPLQQAADYHDAITYASSLQPGSRSRVALWGIGHSGGASMIAGNDPRLSAVVLVMPFTSGAADAAAFPSGTLDKAWKDRAANATSWTEKERPLSTAYVQLWNSSLAAAEGNSQQPFLAGPVPYNFITEARKRSSKVGTPSENLISLQSFYHISNVEPRDYITKISPRPLLYLAAEVDPLTGPIENHKHIFEKAGEPKEFVTLYPNHIATYFGEAFEASVAKQIDFLKRTLLN